uniref:Uncharacterized protein n=1 Tax=Anabas testudineus TaxID=64144 RepID=A0A3Q1K649_ANATE
MKSCSGFLLRLLKFILTLKAFLQQTNNLPCAECGLCLVPGSQKVFVKQVIKHFLNANVPSQQFENIFKAFITDESQNLLRWEHAQNEHTLRVPRRFDPR